jgi:molybdenum cofactor biosynthesis enzyme MoaA
MWRGEMLLTDRCNFKCTYCRPLRKDCKGDVPVEWAQHVVDLWAAHGLKNIRFSGGEPTLWPYLRELVSYAKSRGIERIAISTNGSASPYLYTDLVYFGADDFSISLDSCCASGADMMSGVTCPLTTITDNIKMLSNIAYVTIGAVITEDNAHELNSIITYAHGLGVDDIRIIPAAQDGRTFDEAPEVDQKIYNSHPILAYRLNNLRDGKPIRGLSEGDSRRCYLVLDDSAVAGRWHFPCIIYLREHGNPIGQVREFMRAERMAWSWETDTHEDPICRENCLDVCVAYNNKVEGLRRDAS